MNLGENIYRFRTEKNMSQGDLAEALGVSRQSVSKWENNSAVPELDKLIKMAELFEVSLDLLVGHEKEVQPSTPPELSEAKVIYIEKPALPRIPKQQLTGMILFACAFLYGLILYHGRFDMAEVFFLVLPVAVCGVLYLMTEHPLFYSCWIGAGAYWGHFFILFPRWEHHPVLIVLGVVLVAAMYVWTIRIHRRGDLRIPAWLWVIGTLALIGLLILLCMNCLPPAVGSVVEHAAAAVGN